MRNKNEFYLRFENGMPKATAQQKGECIRYKIINGKRIAYIQHFKKDKVEAARQLYEYKLKPLRPKEPATGPISLTVIFYFDKKSPKKDWGKFKTTKPDADNCVKELIDAMTSVGFWEDDAQIADLHVRKYYAERATIYVRVEELEP